jgi:ABC-type thiamine transport system ATPase subunit
MVKTFIITGDTWSSRGDLKNLGGSWVPHLRAWLVPDTQRDSVVRLRNRIGLDAKLVTLPIELSYTARQRLAEGQAAVSPRIPSPVAS